jgi:hypothetical protein
VTALFALTAALVNHNTGSTPTRGKFLGKNTEGFNSRPKKDVEPENQSNLKKSITAHIMATAGINQQALRELNTELAQAKELLATKIEQLAAKDVVIASQDAVISSQSKQLVHLKSISGSANGSSSRDAQHAGAARKQRRLHDHPCAAFESDEVLDHIFSFVGGESTSSSVASTGGGEADT